LSDQALIAGAQTLGVDAKVLKAIVRVESGGPGFANEKLLISYEPFFFSEATGHRYDASHSTISNQNRAPLAGSQSTRWAKLAEAYALDPAAALTGPVSAAWPLLRGRGLSIRVRLRSGHGPIRSAAARCVPGLCDARVAG
jgi:hypothetical protein